MSTTPDAFPGTRLEEEIELTGQNTDPTNIGGLTYRSDTGNFVLKDSLGSFNPRGGGGLPPATEQGQILYSIDGTSFEPYKPVASSGGWLFNNFGLLIVTG